MYYRIVEQDGKIKVQEKALKNSAWMFRMDINAKPDGVNVFNDYQDAEKYIFAQKEKYELKKKEK